MSAAPSDPCAQPSDITASQNENKRTKLIATNLVIV